MTTQQTTQRTPSAIKKALKGIKPGKRITAIAETDTTYSITETVEVLETGELENQITNCLMFKGEIIEGEVLSVNSETGEVKVLDGDGFEKTINIINFIVTVWPLIRQLFFEIRDFIRELKNKKR